jgi:hypothetical protein
MAEIFPIACVDLDYVVQTLNMSEPSIRALVATGGAIAWEEEPGRYTFPTFQFTNRGTIPSLQLILKTLPRELLPVEIASWFVIPNPDLEDDNGDAVAPATWLATGRDPESVVELARNLALSLGRS